MSCRENKEGAKQGPYEPSAATCVPFMMTVCAGRFTPLLKINENVNRICGVRRT
jgi:hypothetical protein